MNVFNNSRQLQLTHHITLVLFNCTEPPTGGLLVYVMHEAKSWHTFCAREPMASNSGCARRSLWTPRSSQGACRHRACSQQAAKLY